MTRRPPRRPYAYTYDTPDGERHSGTGRALTIGEARDDARYAAEEAGGVLHEVEWVEAGNGDDCGRCEGTGRVGRATCPVCRGSTLSSAGEARMGRPPLASPRTHGVLVRLTDAERARAVRTAEKAGCSLAAVVQRIVEAGLGA